MISPRVAQFVDRCQIILADVTTSGTAVEALRHALDSMPFPESIIESLVIRHVLLRVAARIVTPLPAPLARSVLVALASGADDLETTADAIESVMRYLAPLTSANDEEMHIKPRIARALTIIDERFDDPRLRLGALADAVDMSPCHLSRSLKRTSGLGFLQHIHRRRIARACELLAAGSLSVKQVAAAVGYGRTSEFDRQFKRVFGVTPTTHARTSNQYQERVILSACSADSGHLSSAGRGQPISDAQVDGVEHRHRRSRDGHAMRQLS
jgi:AraC-like DNA-binding protein